MKKVAVLASGGLDSTALLVHYLEKGEAVYPIFCNYGQKMANKEYRAFKDVLDTLVGMYPSHPATPLLSEFQELHLGDLGRSRLIMHGGRNETIMRDDPFRYKGVHEAYVPSRDTLMLLHAASILEERTDISAIAMGTHKTDATNNFPDCTPVIAQKVQDLLNCSTSRSDWVISTPFINMTKDEIRATLADTKFKLLRGFVFSGYGDALEY